MRHLKPDADLSGVAGDMICNVTPLYCINHFALKVIKRELSPTQNDSNHHACCLVLHWCKQNGTCHVFISVRSCGMQFSQVNLEGGLDMNGTHQFLVHNYYVNLMSGTIFGRLKSSRMLWDIKRYEYFDILKLHNGSIFTVMQYKYDNSERISDLTNLLQSVNNSISRKSVILIFTKVRSSDLT